MSRAKVAPNIFSRGAVFLLLLLALLLRFLKQTGYPTQMIICKIYETLISGGVSERLARFICSQAAFETGNFRSPLLKANNNAFGMKQPKKRQTLSIGEKNGYAAFSSIEESTKDFLLYLRSQGYSMEYESIDEFVMELYKKKYFQAPRLTYTKGVQYYYNKYFA